MAQLSDDCFAFGGPMMSVDEAVCDHRRAGHGGAGDRDRGACRGRRPYSGPRYSPRRCRCRRSPIRPSMVMPSRGADLPHDAERGISRDRARSGRRVGRRSRSSRARRCGSLPARRCPKAPTPYSCRRTCGSTADGKVVLPAGLRPGANVRPAGEDIPLGAAALSAGRRLRPQDVALAAAFGLTQARGPPAHPRRGVLDRQRTGVAGSVARRRRNCSTPTASC